MATSMRDPQESERSTGHPQTPAWHFLPPNRRLTYGDGRTVEVGLTTRLSSLQPVSLSHHGLHASERILDALRLAPGPVLCRVLLSGNVQQHGDILVARERHVLWMEDITPLLHRFAVRCARQALTALDRPEPRLGAGLDTKEGWLRGEVDNAQMVDAWEQTFAVAETCHGALEWAVVQTVSQACGLQDIVNGAWQTCQESIQVDLLRAQPNETRDTLLAQRSELLESLVVASFPEALPLFPSNLPRQPPWTSP